MATAFNLKVNQAPDNPGITNAFQGPRPRGRQVKESGGSCYTPVTGIWQTVWLEPVESKHLEHIKFTPAIDNIAVKVDLLRTNHEPGDIVVVSVREAE